MRRLRRGAYASVVPKGQPTAPEIASTVRRRFLRDISSCVEDYPWRKDVFDQDPLGRKARGGTGHWILRDPTDPGHFLLGMNFQSAVEAGAFRDLPDFQHVWEASGAGQSWVLEEEERVAYEGDPPA